MPLRKVPVAMTTGIGGAGVWIFYTLESVDVTVELATFINAIRPLFPNSVTWNIPNSGDTIDIPTGKITTSWTGGTAFSSTGGSASAYVAGTGGLARWGTSGVIDGRRVKGRTFLVPLTTSTFDTAGTLTDSNVTTLNTAAATLAGSGKLVIYSRPSSKGATDGQSSLVTSGSVPDKVVSLRSRRT